MDSPGKSTGVGCHVLLQGIFANPGIEPRSSALLASHLFQNFPQFIVIHTIKGFGIVNKAEVGVFLELSCFFDDPADVGNLISGSSAFSKQETQETGV